MEATLDNPWIRANCWKKRVNEWRKFSITLRNLEALWGCSRIICGIMKTKDEKFMINKIWAHQNLKMIIAQRDSVNIGLAACYSIPVNSIKLKMIKILLTHQKMSDNPLTSVNHQDLSHGGLNKEWNFYRRIMVIPVRLTIR